MSDYKAEEIDRLRSRVAYLENDLAALRRRFESDHSSLINTQLSIANGFAQLQNLMRASAAQYQEQLGAILSHIDEKIESSVSQGLSSLNTQLFTSVGKGEN